MLPDVTATDTEVVWRGAEALRPFLIPVTDLDPFPGNPRRGNVEEIRRSLRRLGQYAPLVVDASDGRRIVKGHHVRLAAIEEGWTHVAAIPNEFADETEARAALVADNRMSEIGEGADMELLVVQLQALAEADALEGTGYIVDDLAFFEHEVARLSAPPDPIPPPTPPPPAPQPPGDLREKVLYYTGEQEKQFDAWVKVVAKERGTHGVSESVYEALRVAAETLNQS